MKTYRDENGCFLIECPGCRHSHAIVDQATGAKVSWAFSGTLERPTFSPSVRHFWYEGTGRTPMTCHYNVTDGRILFHNDCTHGLRGWHDLPDIEAPKTAAP
jgi:hypothetical protein